MDDLKNRIKEMEKELAEIKEELYLPRYCAKHIVQRGHSNPVKCLLSSTHCEDCVLEHQLDFTYLDND
jgi:hypothetical protein